MTHFTKDNNEVPGTIAQEIIKQSVNWTNCIELCEKDTLLKDTQQDFEKETTTFIFEDGSKILITNFHYYEEI